MGHTNTTATTNSLIDLGLVLWVRFEWCSWLFVHSGRKTHLIRIDVKQVSIRQGNNFVRQLKIQKWKVLMNCESSARALKPTCSPWASLLRVARVGV